LLHGDVDCIAAWRRPLRTVLATVIAALTTSIAVLVKFIAELHGDVYLRPGF
jgi:hypothetical protein